MSSRGLSPVLKGIVSGALFGENKILQLFYCLIIEIIGTSVILISPKW
jgi:hypothetical protein